jgi:hypothetical protein
MMGCPEPEPVSDDGPSQDSGADLASVMDTTSEYPESGYPESTDAGVADSGMVDGDASTDTLMGWNCAALPSVPLALGSWDGAIAYQDVAFDDQGDLIGGDDFQVYRTQQNAEPQTISDKSLSPKGLEVLDNGDILVAGIWQNELYRVDAAGFVEVVLGLQSPNALDRGPDGEVYLTEWSGGTIRRVDPYTGANEVLLSGLTLPNGLTLSLEGDAVFFNTAFTGDVYRLELLPDGAPGDVLQLFSGLGSGQLDGMDVDACGNVYVVDNEGAIFRFAPDGSALITLHETDGFHPTSLAWGRGLGGWGDTSLYLAGAWTDGTLSVPEVEIGVAGKEWAWSQGLP